MGTNIRYRPFGAFRFALAMMVLLQHGLVLLRASAREVFYDLELGALAVAVFFALSGFIVAEAIDSVYASRPAAFLANRVLRVVPPYLAAVLLTILADCWLYHAGRLVPLDAPLTGPPWQPRVVLAALAEIVPGLPARRISGQDFSFVPFAWTLRVEFAFYLAAFATCWVARRAGLDAQRRIVGSAFVAGYLLFGTFLLRHGAGGRQLLNIPFFAFGVAAYLARGGTSTLARANLLAAACCVPVAFVLCGERGHPVLAYQLPILLGLFVWLTVLAWAPAPGGAWRRWDRRLGELSYPIYIGHGLVLTCLTSLSNARGAVPYAASVVLSLGVAIGLHLGVEQRLKEVRTRLRGVAV